MPERVSSTLVRFRQGIEEAPFRTNPVWLRRAFAHEMPLFTYLYNTRSSVRILYRHNLGHMPLRFCLSMRSCLFPEANPRQKNPQGRVIVGAYGRGEGIPSAIVCASEKSHAAQNIHQV